MTSNALILQTRSWGPKSQSNLSRLLIFFCFCTCEPRLLLSLVYSYFHYLNPGAVYHSSLTHSHSKRHTSTGKMFTKRVQTSATALEERECNSSLKHHLPFPNLSSSQSLQVTHNILLLKAFSLSTWSGTICLFSLYSFGFYGFSFPSLSILH